MLLSIVIVNLEVATMSKVPDIRAFRNRRRGTSVAPILITALSIAGIAGIGAPLPGYAAPVAKSCQDTDYNGDGSTDFCDLVLFGSYLRNNDPLGDLYPDGIVDPQDVTIFSGCLCDDPPADCQPSVASIGVYFNPEGTISQLAGVVAGTFVDFYIVAHNVPSSDAIGGFTFGLDDCGAILGSSSSLPAGFYGASLSGAGNVGAGSVSTGTEDDCITSGGTVVLMHYHCLYTGGADCTISLRGVDHCSAPSEYPSYVSCISASAPSQWHYFDPNSLSEAVINPSPCVLSDYNGDGRVDFCDHVLFQDYFSRGDPQADLNADGATNITDQSLFSSCLCSGSVADCPTGTATIGVYFDADGLTYQISNPPLFTPFPLYVVAKSVPGLHAIGGYTFNLTHGEGIQVIGSTPPTGFMKVQTFGAGTVSTSTNDDCIDSGGTIVLMTYQVIFMGGDDITITLGGIDHCSAPSASPSYVSCISAAGPSEWHYFDPAAIGEATINLVDFNCNGIADSNEPTRTKSYKIVGNSDGSDWSMGIHYPGTTGCEYTNECGNALPVGSPPAMFVSTFVNWLNTLSPSLQAEIGVFPKRFRVTAPAGTGDFEIGVSSDCGPPWCWVNRGRICTFNPTIEEVDEPTDVPERLEFGVTSYPNPFNPRTTIAFDLPEAAKIELAVYDTAGRLVRTLITGRDFSEGHHEQNWDGRDLHGNKVAAGIYVYRLMAGSRHESGRMILVK